MKTGTTNTHLKKLINEINENVSKENSGFWKRIRKELERSRRRRREVNLERLEKYTKDKEVIVVPGKVLGKGEINHDITVAALQFSEKAKEKIKKTMTIKELLKENPTGKGIRIIG